MRFHRSSRSIVVILLGMLTSISGNAQPRPSPQPAKPPERYKAVLDRLDAMTNVSVNQWRYHTADIPHPEDPALDDSTWTAVTFGRGQSGNSNLLGWYRAWIEIPTTVGGKDTHGARVRLALRVSSLARVFFNGSMVAQGNGNLLLPILINEKAVPGQRILVAVSTNRMTGAQLTFEFPGPADPGTLKQGIQTAVAIMAGFPAGNAEREKQLDAVVKAVDITALDRGDQQAFNQSLIAASNDMAPIRDWMKQFTVRAVGNSHIDMAWLWPWTETVEVVRDTYTTALQLMREYPDFTYTQSSAQTFEWLEQKYPDLFRQIQERVKEGRWEIVGGMWVEPDLNMPDGESIVRQLLVGKRYFKSRFNVDVNIGWNPDSFGYNWQLPQIYKKSGFDYFVTQKISWNEVTVFPHKLFWWQAPDGSRILTYFPHGYSNGVDPVRIGDDVANYAPQTGFLEVMHLYGVGDHGGGPTRQMLDELVRLKDSSSVFPKLSFSTSKAFFDDLQRGLDKGDFKPPVWNDELYLEYHRGCFTTQSETKKLIRENEELLQNAEKFAAFSYLGRHTYPNTIFEESWKKLLFDHFHDIMPGSGIAVNYVDAANNLREVTFEGTKILNSALDDLTTRINTQGEGVPVVIYNPLSWDRTGSVEVNAQLPGPTKQVEVRDSQGQPLVSQLISMDASTNLAKIRVEVKGVPSLGYEVIHVVPITTPRPFASTLKVNGTTIENEFLIMKIDPKTGCIISLINKTDGKETLSPGSCGNLLQAFVDKPARQDAWEIKFDEQSWDLKQPEEIKVTETGPVRAVVHIKHKFQDSTFIQDISVYTGVPRVEVDMKVDWHEKHILLKVGVQPDVKTSVATYEIPYGTIQRPTTRNTPAEQAKFEVPAIRWGDLSDANHGVSLLNASKYGYDAKDNVIRLSLLRAATYPGNGGECCTDQGFHEFTYGLFPHTGNWQTGGTMQQGYELNYPMIAIATTAHTGALPGKHSFARIEPGNVIMTVVKKAEDDDALIFRFYEFSGKQSQAKLQLPEKASGAFETNLMEKKERPLSLSSDGRELTIPTGPYEIKTVSLSFGTKKP